uniref:Protein N-terminal glutamine amidohydrolase n=1 Tax=Nyssomyia neivai TaxID=330878 RepID=A0A1L8DA99_9DIPT
MTQDFIVFPKIGECSYVSCYCEENVWKLCEQVKKNNPVELAKSYAVFVSNTGRTVPLWRQKAGRGDDKVVIWDYHVFFMHCVGPNRCLVYDLDTTLPFPTYFHKYVTETFRSDLALRPEHHRVFRVIPAEEYLAEFASDRRHMRRPDNTWIKPPPPYPPIATNGTSHSLDDFICMTPGKGPGSVHSLSQFVHMFYKPPNLQQNSTTQQNP